MHKWTRSQIKYFVPEFLFCKADKSSSSKPVDGRKLFGADDDECSLLSELFPEEGFDVELTEKPSKRLKCGADLKGFRKRWHERSKLSVQVASPEMSASSTPSSSPTLIGEFANQAFDQLKKRSKTIVMPWEEPLYAPIFGSFIPSLYRTMPEVSFVPEPPSARDTVKDLGIKQEETDATQSIFKWRVQTEKAVDDYHTVNKTKRLVAFK